MDRFGTWQIGPLNRVIHLSVRHLSAFYCTLYVKKKKWGVGCCIYNLVTHRLPKEEEAPVSFCCCFCCCCCCCCDLVFEALPSWVDLMTAAVRLTVSPNSTSLGSSIVDIAAVKRRSGEKKLGQQSSLLLSLSLLLMLLLLLLLLLPPPLPPPPPPPPHLHIPLSECFMCPPSSWLLMA